MAKLPLKNQSKSLTTNLLMHLISVIQSGPAIVRPQSFNFQDIKDIKGNNR